MNININDFVVSNVRFRRLRSWINYNVILSIKDDIYALNGASDFEEYVSLGFRGQQFCSQVLRIVVLFDVED